MSSAPLRMVGAMVIEIGGVLLALALLPGLPWEQWKASIAHSPAGSVEAAEIPPTLPPSGYGFQLDNQSSPLQQRAYTHRTLPAPPTAPRTFTAPPLIDERTAVTEARVTDAPFTADRGETGSLPKVPTQPQQREYVAETLDRASQQILDSLAGPWTAGASNSAAVTESQLANRSRGFRAPPTRTEPAEQQYLRPQYPSNVPGNVPQNSIPNHSLSTPTTRFGSPSPPQPMDRSHTFAAPPTASPTIPLEPAAPKFQSDIAPQSYYAQGNAQGTRAPAYNAQPRPSQFEGVNADYERAPLSNEYYTPRVPAPQYNSQPQANTLPPASAASPSSLTGPTRVRPAGPRHLQY